MAVDGIQFKGENLRVSITISSGDKIITAGDRDRVLEQATNSCKLAKEELVLHRIPQIFHIKGQRDIRNPVGMFGETLEAEVRIIVAPSPVIFNIQLALKNAGLHGADLMYSPLASAEAILRDAETRHPEEPAIQFNLGCYACQRGDLAEARRRVDRAIALDKSFRQQAATDDDLAPLRASGYTPEN